MHFPFRSLFSRSSFVNTVTLTTALTAATVAPSLAFANGEPLWLRNSAISPDGTTLAFTYQSKIYLMPSEGGQAHAITSGDFYPHSLLWSPDGDKIAFAANPYGNDDVFVMSLEKGSLTRLTWDSADDTPTSFSPDSQSVLFNSSRLTAAKQDFYSLPYYYFGFNGNQLYSVSLENNQTKQILPLPAKHALWSLSKTKLIYNTPHQDQAYRKHQTSRAVPTIWLYDATTEQHKQITEPRVAAQSPIWNQDETGFYYLSERSGNFNVWFYNLADEQSTQLTKHEFHPVRHLSVSQNNTISYSYNGELYRLTLPASTDKAENKTVAATKEPLQPEKVAVRIASFSPEKKSYFEDSYADAFVPSNDGIEFALTSYGDIYVFDSDKEVVRQVTRTASEEKNPAYTPDGLGIIYSAYRNSNWGLYYSRSIADEEYLSEAPLIEEFPYYLLDGHDITQAQFSPDGEQLAFVLDGRAVHVIDIAEYTPVPPSEFETESILADDSISGAQSTIEASRTRKSSLPASRELIKPQWVSNKNDVSYQWSPDSSQIAVQVSPDVYSNEIYVVDAKGEKDPINVSQNGFDDLLPQWSQDGRLLTWATNQFGLTSTDGTNVDVSVKGMFTNTTAQMDHQDNIELPEEPKPYPFSGKNLEYRETFQLPYTGQIIDFKASGDHLAFITNDTTPTGEVTVSGYTYNIRTQETETLFSHLPEVQASHISDIAPFAYLLVDGEIIQIDLESGDQTSHYFTLPINFDYDARKQSAYQDVLNTTKNNFYLSDLGNVNWALYGDNYARFLPHINNDKDFAIVLSELLGELNASHTDAYGSSHSDMTFDQTAELGLVFDTNAQSPIDNNNLVIAEILPGGPFDTEATDIHPGDVVVSVNGQPVNHFASLAKALNHQEDKKVEIGFRRDSTQKWSERITPISQFELQELMVKRWEIQRRNYVTKQSGGKVGYIYLPDMSNETYQHVVAQALGRFRNTEVLLLDIRFNGGGFLADTLIEFLTAKSAANVQPKQGQAAADANRRKWIKPSVVLTNAAAYSEGSAFGQYYQDLNVGPIIGEPVPGTGTAVMDINSAVYPRIQYRFPYLPLKRSDGKLYENLELIPDIEVHNRPEDVINGIDRQLDTAISEALKLTEHK